MSGPPPAHVLVVAKAPVPGLAKTRLGAEVGMVEAATLATAALLDTLDAAQRYAGPHRCHVALAGDLDEAVDGGGTLRAALTGWTVRPQVEGDFDERLAAAHAEVPGPVVQVGMDTPQVTPDLLAEVVAGLADHDAVLAPAADGGWWALALRDPRDAVALRGVPMSTAGTGAATRAALEAAGLSVGSAPELVDVDEVDDARAVAAAAPSTRFARGWRAAIGEPDPSDRVVAPNHSSWTRRPDQQPAGGGR
ncbi:TIGR04282 family arsenosugar biosynthesis glycosyltransferase [Nocardioides sp. CPCC 205120]|uniref:TIGR04282 family arsenosugar biosynthesis glycosyltransferase n=1 Tax=Nocardioides sp. CPCC 205120 TaxID=3406462 RepID=UPI003B50C2B7